VLQALARPYPEAEIEVEDIGSTGDRAGLGDAVTTVRLGQTLETGRKREARTRLAERDRDLGGWDNRSLREDVRRDTAAQFAGVLAAQQRLRLLQNAGALAERLLATVSARVAAGKDSPSEQNKANVALANRRLELRRAEGDLAGARVRLAALWGATEATFAEASGDLAAIPELPELARLLEALATNPDLARWSTEEAQRTAALALARAGRAPDVTVGAGVAWSGAEDDATFEVSASVPLPIWDRNQGAIREAAAELRKATAERHAVETGLRAALIAQHQELATARQEALGLRDEVLPEARRALELAQTAFAQGKTTYLDVVDAQQTLFEAEWQHVEALAACHAAVAEIERTAGPRTNR
jgi:cobalt-zinc-cadmium efflux system outer membrane protein